jgi:hypothetical protein
MTQKPRAKTFPIRFKYPYIKQQNKLANVVKGAENAVCVRTHLLSLPLKKD